MRTWAPAAMAVVLFGCAGEPARAPAVPPPVIKVDGSSTVYTISKDVAERYKRTSTNVVEVAVSGTGGGFKKFCNRETAVQGASRPINAAEIEACSQAGVEFIELPVAFDGIAVVVHPDNDWLSTITVAELRRLWEPAAEGKIVKWSDMRKDWPPVRIHLVGPGRDSGTYDYFTQATVGQQAKSRHDYLASEDDFVLVEAVARDGFALGFFGYGYYVANKERLKLVPVDDGNAANGAGPIAPAFETIRSGSYVPLSRPLFIYVSMAEVKRPEVDDFVRFYLDVARAAVHKVGYVPLPGRALELTERRFAERKTGTVFAGTGAELGLTVEAVLEAETRTVVATPR